MRKLFYNPLLEDDDEGPGDERSSWEKYIEGLERAEKMSVEDWFDQLDSDRNPF